MATDRSFGLGCGGQVGEVLVSFTMTTLEKAAAHRVLKRHIPWYVIATDWSVADGYVTFLRCTIQGTMYEFGIVHKNCPDPEALVLRAAMQTIEAERRT